MQDEEWMVIRNLFWLDLLFEKKKKNDFKWFLQILQ